MKKYTILAAALMFAGVANAQAPTNTYQGIAPRAARVPSPNPANAPVAGASQGSFSSDFQDYSQDSYINQAGNRNNATVNQTDGRTSAAGGGSTAVIDQTGDDNTANQTQTLQNTTFSNDPASLGGRNFAKSTQAGSSSQSDQTQEGGGYNRMDVTQGAGTTGNRAIQTQRVVGGQGDGNQASIAQTRFAVVGGGSGNRAEQDQSGYNHIASISQESSNSFAKQTQRGGGANPISLGNSARIHQGDPGDRNTAIQDQEGTNNTARIQQGVSPGASADGNFAKQTQSNDGNQADIDQKSSNNYAEQVQSGMRNFSSMSQDNVSSAAYSTQSGNNNSATVTQR